MKYPLGQNLPSALKDVNKMVRILKAKDYKDLGLVCTGSSGAIIAGIIAAKLKPTPKIFYIKKKYEHNHGHGTNALTNCGTLVFVDDFVSSGDTAKHIIRQLKLHKINGIQAIIMAVCRPIYLTGNNIKFFKEQLNTV